MLWRRMVLVCRWSWAARRCPACFGAASVIIAAVAFLLSGRSAQAQNPPPPPVPATLESICQPAAGEIGLEGTLQRLSPDKRQLTLLVTVIRTSDGKKTTLAVPRSKEIGIAVGAAVFRAAGETAEVLDAAGALDALVPGATIVCLGANSGQGRPLLARSMVILRDAAAGIAANVRLQPGKNLLPPITGENAWWVLPIGGKTSAESSRDEDALKITVSAVDDQDWHVLLSPRKDTELVSGAVYQLSFRARADKEHPYVAQSQVNQGDFHNTGLFKKFTVTTDWQPYRFVFTAHDTVAGHSSCPSFAIGKEVGTLWVKEMVLEVLGATAASPGNLLRPIADPESWSLLLMNGAQASLAREKDSLRVSVIKATGKNADAQVVQYGISVVEDKWYTVRFRARSPIERTIRISSGVTKQPYHDIGLERLVKIGAAEKSFVLTFQAKKPQDWPAGLNLAPSFLIGDVPGTLWLSDIEVVPGKAPEHL